MRETTLQTPKSGKKEGTPDTRAEIPLQTVVKTTERKAVHLLPIKDHGSENRSVKSPSPEEKAAKTMFDELTKISIPQPSVFFGDRR